MRRCVDAKHRNAADAKRQQRPLCASMTPSNRVLLVNNVTTRVNDDDDCSALTGDVLKCAGDHQLGIDGTTPHGARGTSASDDGPLVNDSVLEDVDDDDVVAMLSGDVSSERLRPRRAGAVEIDVAVVDCGNTNNRRYLCWSSSSSSSALALAS